MEVNNSWWPKPNPIKRETVNLLSLLPQGDMMQDPQRAAKDAGQEVSDGIEGAINKGKDALKDITNQAEDAADDASSWVFAFHVSCSMNSCLFYHKELNHIAVRCNSSFSASSIENYTYKLNQHCSYNQNWVQAQFLCFIWFGSWLLNCSHLTIYW